MSDGTMDRRAFLEHATVGCVVLAAPRRLPGFAPGVSGPTGQLAAPFELEEVTIAALQAGLEAGKYTRPKLPGGDRKRTPLNPSHSQNSNAVFCLKKKKICWIWKV